MELEEFNKAFQFGVDTGGRGIRDPSLLGYNTVTEAKEGLAQICSTPLWDETHVYRVSVSESKLVGINARSKEHADKKLERERNAGLAIGEYVGELNDLLEDLDE